MVYDDVLFDWKTFIITFLIGLLVALGSGYAYCYLRGDSCSIFTLQTQTTTVRVNVIVNAYDVTGKSQEFRGSLVIADSEDLQRRGYELVSNDLGVLFVFKDLPKAVCFKNPFNYSINIYVVRVVDYKVYYMYSTYVLGGYYAHQLKPNSQWCTLLLPNEFILETTNITQSYIYIYR